MDKSGLSRLAHNQKNEGSNPSPATTSNFYMFDFLKKNQDPERQTDQNKGVRDHDLLPLNPEENPPDSLEELELLISKLQHKVDSISMRLTKLEMCIANNEKIDELEYKRAMYAKKRTNRSINILQRIAKRRRLADPNSRFESVNSLFVKKAKNILDSDTYSKIMIAAVEEYRHSFGAQ